MNRFAHKHIGQLTVWAILPKHELQSRKHAKTRKKTKLWRKPFAEIIHFPPFLCFPCADCTPFSLPLSFTLPSCTFHSVLHISDPPYTTLHLTTFKTTLIPSLILSFSLSVYTSFPPSPHYLTLWLDAQWVTPLLKSSEMQGGGSKRKKSSGREKKQESMTERKI